ncbi:MAG: hypothetical protein K2G60_05840 [Oscillospiraceae bacterium]|nr:hypothetical protein [Oscillospiraceae bacterium]
MENEKIKKVNPLYMLAYIFLPIIIAIALTAASVSLISNSGIGTLITAAVFFACIFWYAVGGQKFYKSMVKKFEAELDSKGFKRNQTFYGKNQTVIVDIADGRIASVFFWNPFKYYITSASKIERAWVDDGKKGAGFMEGSQRVRFCFIFDGIRMNVDTFISNQRYKMTDSRILDGISKADLMVEVLNKAKANAVSSGK